MDEEFCLSESNRRLLNDEVGHGNDIIAMGYVDLYKHQENVKTAQHNRCLALFVKNKARKRYLIQVIDFIQGKTVEEREVTSAFSYEKSPHKSNCHTMSEPGVPEYSGLIFADSLKADVFYKTVVEKIESRRAKIEENHSFGVDNTRKIFEQPNLCIPTVNNKLLGPSVGPSKQTVQKPTSKPLPNLPTMPENSTAANVPMSEKPNKGMPTREEVAPPDLASISTNKQPAKTFKLRGGLIPRGTPPPHKTTQKQATHSLAGNTLKSHVAQAPFNPAPPAPIADRYPMENVIKSAPVLSPTDDSEDFGYITPPQDDWPPIPDNLEESNPIFENGSRVPLNNSTPARSKLNQVPDTLARNSPSVIRPQHSNILSSEPPPIPNFPKPKSPIMPNKSQYPPKPRVETKSNFSSMNPPKLPFSIPRASRDDSDHLGKPKPEPFRRSSDTPNFQDLRAALKPTGISAHWVEPNDSPSNKKPFFLPQVPSGLNNNPTCNITQRNNCQVKSTSPSSNIRPVPQHKPQVAPFDSQKQFEGTKLPFQVKRAQPEGFVSNLQSPETNGHPMGQAKSSYHSVNRKPAPPPPPKEDAFNRAAPGRRSFLNDIAGGKNNLRSVKPDQEKKPSGNEPFNSVMQRVLKERQERMQSEYCMNDDEAEGYDSDDWT